MIEQSNETVATCEKTDGVESVALKSLERDLKDVIKAGEKASNALAALWYEDANGVTGGD